MTKSEERPEKTRMSELLQKLPKSTTPIQEVTPVAKKRVKADEEETEKISGVWVPKSLAKRLKHHAVTSEKTIRQISIEAYELYLSSQPEG